MCRPNIREGCASDPARRLPKDSGYPHLSAGSTGDEVPDGEDIHSVPLHIDAPRESDRPVHGEDHWLSRRTCCLLQGILYTCPLKECTLERAFPLSLRNSRQIRAGEFIEMDELLPEVWTKKERGEPELKRRCGRKVLDIFTWLQCFGIYVSIRDMQSPTSIPEFMAYKSIIVRVNQEYAGMVWLNYDTLYRKHAALKKDTKWSVINTTIYTPGVSWELPGTQ